MPDGGLFTWYGYLVLLWQCVFLLSRETEASQSTRTANIGATQILGCALKTNVPPTTKLIIEWKKYGVDKKSFTVFLQYDSYPQNINANYEGRIRLVNRTSLEISHIRASDEGLYECTITYIDGVEDGNNSTWVHLVINAPPKIVSSSPSTVRASQEATVSLSCRASGTPTPDVVWSKDGVPLSNTNRLTIALNKETITIKNLQRSDGGTYSCTFQNTVGRVSQRIDLIVQGAAYILNKPSNMTVLKGQRVTFTCGADAFPDNITYRWYFRGTNVRDLPGYGTRITALNDGGTEQLIISPVYETDMGWYTCRPSNGVGEDPEASAFLNVTYPPVVLIDKMPSRVTWALGFRQRLDCPVDANPPVHEVSWTKNSYVVDFSSNRLTQLSNGSLLIYQVEQVDAGSYSCTPISSIGSGQSSPLVQVTVQDPPRFTIRPDLLYQRRPGEVVTMPCAAAGKPTPEIQWRKVTGKLNTSGRIHLNEGNLTITQLNKVDHGKYECEAKNDFATIVAVTELIIQDTTPHAPYNVSAVPDWFSVRLSWIPAYNGGSQEFFIIWYRSTNGQTSQWLTMQVVPQSATHFTVYKLQPDTIYEFKIMARNINGDGNFSEVVTVKTLGIGAPLPTALPTDSSGKMYYPTIDKTIGPRPLPPRNVSASVVRGGVRISWLPPLPSDVRMTYFVIELSEPGRDWRSLAQFLNITSTSYTWTDYIPDTTYFFRMYTYSITSYSIPSDTASIRTPALQDTAPSTEVLTTPTDYSKESSGFFLSQAEIGGIIGGLLFLLVAVLLAIIGVICSKRREKHRPEKYGNVRYIGPADEVDTAPDYRIQDTTEWSGRDKTGGAGSLGRDYITSGIFIVPQTNEIYRDTDMVARDYLAESQLYHPDDYVYNSDKGYRVPYAGGHDSHEPLLRDDESVSRSRSRSRTRKYSFPSDRDHSVRSRLTNYSGHPSSPTGRVDQSGSGLHRDNSLSPDCHSYNRYPSNRYHQEHPYVIHSLPHSSSSSRPSYHDNVNKRDYLPPRPPIGNKANGFLPERYSHLKLPEDDSDDDANGFLPKRPPLPAEFRTPVPSTSHSHGLERPSFYGPRGYNEPHYENIPVELDDVFVPSFDHTSPPHPSRAGFPRHSSMKPSYQTYLTGDPVDEGHTSQPFVDNDISSVLPSFAESSIHQSKDSNSPYFSEESTLVAGSRLEKPRWNMPFAEDQLARDIQRTSRPMSRSSDIRPRSRSSEGRPYTHFDSLNDTVCEKLPSENGSMQGKPPQYTRDHLQGTVEKIRKGPRARRARSAGRLTTPDYGSEFPSHTTPRGPTISDSELVNGNYDYQHDKYSNDIEPYKSKRDSRSSMNSSGRGSLPGRSRHGTEPGRQQHHDLTPDSLSSGVGSRNNSHVTGSSGNSRVPYPHASASIDSMGLPLDHDISEDSSPFLDNSARKDTSADDQYEFDSLQALENELINTLREYPNISGKDEELMSAIQTGLSTSDFYDDLYPKPSHQSRYEDSEARFERLRQEFHQFQRKQQERHQQIRLAMDSDML